MHQEKKRKTVINEAKKEKQSQKKCWFIDKLFYKIKVQALTWRAFLVSWAFCLLTRGKWALILQREIQARVARIPQHV